MGAIYQALYRKYRPRTFDDVWGQEHITETLKRQVETGRLSHAYLFVGTRGTGKTTCAKLLARAVNCEHPVNGSPCGECPSCLGIEAGTIMDVVEIDAASNNGVDNIRALRDEAVFSPATVKKRVYIVDEVHMLSTSAFNALLKILEEPPEHLMFILATTELRKVPATIVSRCQRFNFRRLDADVIAKRLKFVAGRESINLTDGAAELLARLADGGMRDALSLLDQCSGRDIIDENTVLEATGSTGSLLTAGLLDAVAAHDVTRALSIFSELWRDGKDPAGVLSDLTGLMRDALLLSIAPKGADGLLSGMYDRETLRRFASMFTHEELLRNMSAAQAGVSAQRDSPSARTTAELTLVTLCDGTLSGDTASLAARLSRVEAELSALRAGGLRAAPVQAPAAEPEPAPAARTPAPEPAATISEGPSGAPEDDDVPPWGDDDAPPPPDDGDAPFEPDYIPQRAASPAPAPAPAPAPEPPAGVPADAPAPEAGSGAGAAPGGFDWQRFLTACSQRLPIGFAVLMRNENDVRGELHGDHLTIYVVEGMLCDYLRRGDTLDKLRAAASDTAGREVNVTVEASGDGVKRSIEELRQFKDTVRFI